jgi:hypothetical protein
MRRTNRKAEAQHAIGEIARKGKIGRGLPNPAQKTINGTMQGKG